MTSPPSGPRRELRPAEVALCARIGGPGLASVGQIQAARGDSERTATRTWLRGWERAGVLARRRINLRGWSLEIVSLTEAGRTACPPALRPVLRLAPPAAEVLQALLLQAARLRLEAEMAAGGGQLVSWTDEHSLRADYSRATLQARRTGQAAPDRRSADAAARLRSAAGEEIRVAIEADGAYYGQMLAGKVAALQALAGESERILYIAVPEREPIVRRAIADVPAIEVVIVPREEIT